MTSQLHRFNGLKILAHADKLDEIARGSRPWPIEWVVYPSNVCNHKCVWCLAKGTLIATPHGQVAIETLTAGATVYGPSGRINTISGVSKRIADDIYEIQIGEQKLICSGEHPILTQDGWKQAKDCSTKDSAVVRVRMREALSLEHSVQKVGEVSPRARVADGSPLRKERVELSGDILQGPPTDTHQGTGTDHSILCLDGISLERGLELRPITHVNRRGQEEVFNFSCSPDQAYEANGIVVHNCIFRQPSPDGHIEQLDPDTRVTLSRELLFRFVEDAARLGGSIIQFEGGGEPLLNKHTVGAMHLAQRLAECRPRGLTKQLKVALSTNGTLLTPEVASLVDYLRVSLNAGTKGQHHKTNHAGEGDSDWDRIIDNIAISAKHRRGDIGLGFVVDHENWRDILAFCHLAADLKVDFVHIRPAFYWEPHLDQAVREVMPRALAMCEQAKSSLPHLPIYSITDKFEGHWSPRSYQSCLAVWTGVVLRATGNFAVCKDRTDLNFGKRYKDGATFEEVWHSLEHQHLAASITAEGGELNRCPRCVWGFRNQVIHEVFSADAMRLSLM